MSSGSVYEQERTRLQGIYGHEPFRWLGWANSPNEAVIRSAFKTASGLNSVFTAEQLYTLAIGEGLNLYIEANYTANQSSVTVTNEVDGFNYLGLDFFGSDISRLKAGSFIRQSFKKGANFTADPTVDYVEATRVNEQGLTVPTANFKNLAKGLEAFEAVMAHRRSLVKNDAGTNALDADNLFFWAYAYFVDGEGDGKRHLTASNYDYTKSTRTVIKEKCLKRLATWHYVDKFIDFF